MMSGGADSGHNHGHHHRRRLHHHHQRHDHLPCSPNTHPVLFQKPALCELGRSIGVWVAGTTSIPVDVADSGTDELRDLEHASAAVPVMLAGGSKTHGRAGRSARAAHQKWETGISQAAVAALHSLKERSRNSR